MKLFEIMDPSQRRFGDERRYGSPDYPDQGDQSLEDFVDKHPGVYDYNINDSGLATKATIACQDEKTAQEVQQFMQSQGYGSLNIDVKQQAVDDEPMLVVHATFREPRRDTYDPDEDRMQRDRDDY